MVLFFSSIPTWAKASGTFGPCAFHSAPFSVNGLEADHALLGLNSKTLFTSSSGSWSLTWRLTRCLIWRIIWCNLHRRVASPGLVAAVFCTFLSFLVAQSFPLLSRRTNRVSLYVAARPALDTQNIGPWFSASFASILHG